MSASDYVFSQVNHERRAKALAQAAEIDFAADAQLDLAKTNLAASPFPHVPTSLFGHIKVILPGEPEREGDVIEGTIVVLDETIWREYGSVITPYLSAQEARSLADAGAMGLLMEYWSFAGAYLSYTRAVLAYWDAEMSSLKARYEYLHGTLTLHYDAAKDPDGHPLKARVRDIYVGIDPAVLEVKHRKERAAAVCKALAASVKSLEEVAGYCSRCLTHWHSETSFRAPQPMSPSIDPMQRLMATRGSGRG